ncbi:MAG: foldase [Phycisphaerales bacterium]|nr:foldase [Phycisphaerales bacterium]
MLSQPNVSKTVSKAARKSFAKSLASVTLSAGLLAGCTPSKQSVDHPTPPPFHPTTTPATTQAMDDPVIATVGTTQIRRSELEKPMLEAYGFNMLMLLIQRDMARDACQQGGIKVSPADIKYEYNWTVDQMFPNLQPGDDREKLLDQFLAQPKPHDQMSTRAELAIIVDTNARLRKLVEPNISKAITDQMLQDLFDEEYGAQAKVRIIVVANPQEATAVRRQLDAGDDFAAVARQVSRDPNTKRLGGELPPFTPNTTRLPDNFKKAAFALKPGEVSDPVAAAGGYYLIKLEQRIPPKAIKFQDVKGSLREDYSAKLVLEAVKGVRSKLAQQALQQLAVTEPTLKAEFDRRLAARDQLIRDREKMRDQMEKDRQKAAVPATAPAGPAAPAVMPATNAPTSAATTVPGSTEKNPTSVPATPPPAIDKTPTATEPVAPPAPPATAPASKAAPAVAAPAPVEAIRPAPAPMPAPAPATMPATVPSTRPS